MYFSNNDFILFSIPQNLDELLDHKSDLSEKLCQIGDSIVYKLVQWTKRLPFYLELPVEVHTRLLTHKWHELLVLTTSAYQAMHGQHKFTNVASDETGADFMQEVIISFFFSFHYRYYVIRTSFADQIKFSQIYMCVRVCVYGLVDG